MNSTVPTSPPQGDWRQQMKAMEVAPVDAAREHRGAHRSRGLARRHVGAVALLTLAIAAGMGLYVAGVGTSVGPSDGGPSIPVALIPAAAIAIVGAAGTASRVRRAVEAGNDQLAPLALETTAVPRIVHRPSSPHRSHQLEGSTVMKGQRHGREVEIVMDVRRYETVVAGTYPPFTVTSTTSGLMAAEGAPPAVNDVIATLRGDRWARVEVAGGPDGIRVRRKVRASRKPDALWLSDLWLAERLADQLDRR